MDEHPKDYSVEEIVTVHYEDGQRVAATFFNGHIEMYNLKRAMSRKEYNEFHKTHIMNNTKPL